MLHEFIIKKLKYFHENHKIPNLLFHGPCGSGKKTILNQFIQTVYDNDKDKIKKFVMYVNCAHGKGIKFIRDELKFFSKMHIYSNGGNNFKSIILLNADKLTIDAQSALRRCIELFNHTTRFFIVVEDKYKLLKPILSRFCEIYIPEPLNHKEKTIQLYTSQLNDTFHFKEVKTQQNDWLKKYFEKHFQYGVGGNVGGNEGKKKENEKNNQEKVSDLISHSVKIYEKGYSGLDIMRLLEKENLDTTTVFKNMNETKKNELLFHFHKIKKEFRNEKIIIFFFLNFIFLSLDYSLENISFI